MTEAFEEQPPPPPLDWRGLSGDEAYSAWQGLDEWVRWLVERFNLPTNVIPPCWHLHTKVVEDLSALWTAHSLWYDDASPGNGPLSWLRELEWSTGRLRAAVAETSCNAREHFAPRVETWITSEEYAEGLEQTILADTNARDGVATEASMQNMYRVVADEA